MLCMPVFIYTSGSSALLGAHVVVYQSDCQYLPYSIHGSEFMPVCFTRKQTKHENTQKGPPTVYWAHKAINTERALSEIEIR